MLSDDLLIFDSDYATKKHQRRVDVGWVKRLCVMLVNSFSYFFKSVNIFSTSFLVIVLPLKTDVVIVLSAALNCGWLGN